MIWCPHLTVAAVIERDGKFLLVEEDTPEGIRFNQPAGHVEQAESILTAVIRETREETAWEFTPNALIGLYYWQRPDQAVTYLRVAFSGQLGQHDPEQVLDQGIRQAVWLSYDEILARQNQWRSRLVLDVIDDYLANKRYPLTLLTDYHG